MTVTDAVGGEAAGTPQRKAPQGIALLRVPPARADVHIIEVTGVVGRADVARLTRLIDARLRLVAAGHVPTRQIVVDLHDARGLTAADVDDLARARTACHAHRVGFALVAPASADLSLQASHALSRLPAFPSVHAALAAI
jgi:hypothetical protein